MQISIQHQDQKVCAAHLIRMKGATMTKLMSDLEKGLEQAAHHLENKLRRKDSYHGKDDDPKRPNFQNWISSSPLELKELRSDILGLSQVKFAEAFEIPVSNLRNWEQGLSEPDRGSRVLLTLIAVDPIAVIRMLNKSRTAISKTKELTDA